MGTYIQQLAEQVGGSIPSALMGIALGGYNDRRQRNQQEALQEIQMKGSREMMDYQMMKQLEMWQKTGYGPQIEQMKKAGINPALMYGMGGGGGQTVGSANASVGGAQAPTGGREVQDIMGMGLMQAQKQLLEAQAKKTEVETNKIGGVDTTKTQTEIDALKQNINNAKATESLTKVQTDLANIEKHVQGKSAEDRIDYIAWQAGRALYEMEGMEREVYIQKATMNNVIDTVKQEYIAALLGNALTQAQIGQTQAQTTNIQQSTEESKAKIAKMAQDIAQGWQGLDNATKEMKINALMQGLEQEKGYQWNNVRYEYKTKITEGIKKILNGK